MAITVFVADADRAVADSIANVLNQDARIQALVCMDACGAVLLSRTITPDVVLLDLGHDPRSAVMAAAWLQREEGIRVAFTTTSLLPESSLRCSLPESAADIQILRKPMDPEDMARRVEMLLQPKKSMVQGPERDPVKGSRCRRYFQIPLPAAGTQAMQLR